MQENSSPSFTPARKWKIALHVCLTVAALLVILALVNYMAFRHPIRFNWSGDGDRQLSSRTHSILESLTNEVEVIVFFDRREPLYSSVSELLEEYEAASSNIDITYVDYVRYPGRGRLIRSEYRLTPGLEGDCIIFDAGGDTRIVAASELSEYDTSAVFSGEEIKRTAFRGEQLFTSAIYSVVDPEQPRAYFLRGHGEHNPADKDDQRGYYRFAQLLQRNHVEVGMLSLVQQEIPEKCDLLIIPGPKRVISSKELEKISRYLNRGGRMLLLFGFEGRNVNTGLEKVLREWGVEVGHNYVQDKTQSKSGDPQLLLVEDFAGHPVVNPLQRSRLLLVLPRTVGAKETIGSSADAARVVELAHTSMEGQAAVPIGNDRAEIAERGRLPLMVAIEKGNIQGVSRDRGATRMLVVGESFFLSNQLIETEANYDFANLAVNWLLNRDLIVDGIGPRPIKEYRLNLTHAQMHRVGWLILAVLPGAVLLAGVVVWFKRRS